MAIKVQKKKFFGTEQESFEAANEAFTKFRQLTGANIALNNLFIFDDTIQREMNSPLFALRGEFPFNELGTLPYPNGSGFKILPDKVTVSTISLELYETAETSAWEYYDIWHSKVYHENGTFNLPEGDNGFKRDLTVYRYDQYFNKVFGIKYYGVFPISISPYTPSYDDPNVVVFTVTFSVDDVKRLKNFGNETALSVLDSNIKQPYRPDVNETWANAKNNADAAIAANKRTLEESRTLREKIYANLQVRKNIKSKLTDAGLSESAQERLGGGANMGAYSLFYSRRG